MDFNSLAKEICVNINKNLNLHRLDGKFIDMLNNPIITIKQFGKPTSGTFPFPILHQSP